MAETHLNRLAFLGTDEGEPFSGNPSAADSSFPQLEFPYPLARNWDSFCRNRARRGDSESHGTKCNIRATALECAEIIAADAITWQDDFGAIIDPYLAYESSTCTPRFVGLIGQLIGLGRIPECLDACVLSYENCLAGLRNPQIHPEFAFKELLLAHRVIAPLVDAKRRERWERYWRAYDSKAAFNCVQTDVPANSKSFAAIGEQLRIDAGLGGDPELVDWLLASELSRIDEFGMYHDPHCPMTYHAVVLQQLGMLLLSGYSGKHRSELDRAVRRGAVTSLFMQSVTGQAPFGGRSNQFNHTEAQNAALFEEMASLSVSDGDLATASVFRAAAAASIQCIAPWMLGLKPWRHLKQGFHPDQDHGTDSGGPYSVYGILTGSLLCIALHYAPDIECSITPAEVGGYGFEVDPCFAKGFAAASGWSIEVDLRATPDKDATGLGRIQHNSLRPETIISGSIPANPAYSFAFPTPQNSLAIGPVWGDETKSDGATTEGLGYSHRLSDYSTEVNDFSFSTDPADSEHVKVTTKYDGMFDGVREVREEIKISDDGVQYRAFLSPVPANWAYVFPCIETDGLENSTSEISVSSITNDAADTTEPGDGYQSLHTIHVKYRGDTYLVCVCGGHVVLTDEIDTNRNARYRAVLAIPDGSDMNVTWRVL